MAEPIDKRVVLEREIKQTNRNNNHYNTKRDLSVSTFDITRSFFPPLIYPVS